MGRNNKLSTVHIESEPGIVWLVGERFGGSTARTAQTDLIAIVAATGLVLALAAKKDGSGYRCLETLYWRAVRSF